MPCQATTSSGECSIGDPNCPPHLTYSLNGRLDLFVRRDGVFEVTGVGEAVRTDRAEFGQSEGAAVVLADVAAGRAVEQFHPHLHPAGDDHDLAGFGVDDAELGPEPQSAVFGDEQHFPVAVVEVLVLHGPGQEVQVGGHPGLGDDVAGGGDGADPAVDERLRAVRDGDRVPPHGPDGDLDLGVRGAAPQTGSTLLNRPQCRPWAGSGTARTVRYWSGGAVNGDPLSCSA